MCKHEDLMKAEKLVEWSDGVGLVIFVSHQWTSFDQPDPANDQFMMLAAFFSDDMVLQRLLVRSESRRSRGGAKRVWSHSQERAHDCV